MVLALASASACGGEKAPREVPVMTPAPPPAADDPWATPHTPTLRSRPELIEAMRTGHANAVKGAAIEQLPPRDEELAWMFDRALSVSERVDMGGALYLDVKEIMKALMTRGFAGAPGVSAEAAQWLVASVAVLGRVTEVMARELVPSLDPAGPAHAEQVERVTQLARGAEGMLVGSLLMMQDPLGNLWVRREYVRRWARNVGAFTLVWTAEQCRSLSEVVAPVSREEQDVEIARALQEILDALAHCPKPI